MKKILFYSTIFLLLSVRHLNSQCNFNTDSIVCDVTQPDFGYKVIQDYIGNYVICGNITNTVGYDAGYLVKATSQGDTIWRKKFDFTAHADVFRDIKEMPDKSYIILGTTTSTVSVNHVFITKIDTNGVLLWYKQFTYPENDFASQIQITGDNKLLILGYSKSYTPSKGDILLIKTDLGGNLIWRKLLGSPSLDENYTSLQIINNSTAYLLGGTERPSSNYNIAITKLDTAGNILWKKLNGNLGQDLYGNTICQTFDKGYFIGGKSNTQGRVWKLDSTGTIQWSNAFGLNSNTIIKEVKQLADSNLVYIVNDNYLHSSSNSVKAGILAKVDRNGNLLWEKFYKRPSVGQHIVQFSGLSFTKDNGFIMTGSVVNMFGAPYSNLWLVKTDSLGNDSSNCMIYIGVKELDKKGVKVTLYPNPNKGMFKLSINSTFNRDEIIDVSIYDILGQTINYKKLDNNTGAKLFEIETETLYEGIYFIKLTQNNKDIWQSKFVIEK
jgi:hypothetical protein